MAKDGTMRGGARVGAGRKQDPLSEKILEGRITVPEDSETQMVTAEIVGEDMPPVKEYLKQIQRDGGVLCSKEVYEETYMWLCQLGIEKKINPLLIDQYAQSVGRWVDVEKKVSETGYLAKHPTTGAAIASPYVAMSQAYYKQVSNSWYVLYQAVRENSTEIINGTPQDNLMEKLLNQRS